MSSDPNKRPTFGDLFNKLANQNIDEKNKYLLDSIDMNQFENYIKEITQVVDPLKQFCKNYEEMQSDIEMLIKEFQINHETILSFKKENQQIVDEIDSIIKENEHFNEDLYQLIKKADLLQKQITTYYEKNHNYLKTIKSIEQENEQNQQICGNLINEIEIEQQKISIIKQKNENFLNKIESIKNESDNNSNSYLQFEKKNELQQQEGFNIDEENNTCLIKTELIKNKNEENYKLCMLMQKEKETPQITNQHIEKFHKNAEMIEKENEENHKYFLLLKRQNELIKEKIVKQQQLNQEIFQEIKSINQKFKDNKSLWYSLNNENEAITQESHNIINKKENEEFQEQKEKEDTNIILPKLQEKNQQQYKSKIEKLRVNIENIKVLSNIKQTQNFDFNLVFDTKTSNKYIAKTFKNFDNDFNLNKYIFRLHQFQHVTIARFVGYSELDFSGKPNPTIFIQYANKGSLNDNKGNDMKFGTIILLGIARSMMLLHKHNIVHGNLKPSKILLDQNLNPYLSDLGVSQFNNLTISNTCLYTAPEVLKDQKLFLKSDVYSFGIIMYQITTNFNNTSNFESLTCTHQKELIIKGYRPHFTSPINPILEKLIKRCWSENLDARPSFEEIFYSLAYDTNCYINGILTDHVLKYVDCIKKDLIFCKICQENIENKDLLYYSGYPYHKECIECAECHKKLSNNELNDFKCITPGIFICKEHHDIIQNNSTSSQNILETYHDKKIENMADEVFNPPIYNDDNILQYHLDDVFIDSDMIQNSFQINKPYDCIIPTVKFHCDKPLNEVDFKKLQELLGDDVIILKIESGSIFLKIAFLTHSRLSKIRDKFNQFLEPLKNKLNSSIGKSIVGNFVNDPENSIPNDQDINNIYNMKSINILQNTLDLDKIEMQYIENEVNSLLLRENTHQNWSFLFRNKNLFEDAEIQVRKDIQNNAFEMIITGQTIIANRYLDEYNKIKTKIQSGNTFEGFLYHGSRINNHQKIVDQHFLMPGVDAVQQLDMGYYGKGIYATENLFYAAVYGAGYHILNVNEKTSVFCCRAIYNKSKVKELYDLSCYGQKIQTDIAGDFGIHHSMVGNKKAFHPISNSEKEVNSIVSEEFVFANKFQIIPICSFTVMRSDHLILWKDENIENNENSGYLKELSKKIEANIYFKKSVDDALNLIKLKKHNQIKLITNGGIGLTGKKLIEEARKIIKSNFVCLVFASNSNHIKWVSEIENVLFTTSPSFFKEFAELKMIKKDVLDFIQKLEKDTSFKFKINENELLNYPLFNDHIPIG